MRRRAFLASASAAALPAAAAPTNLLFLMTDQMRWDVMSCVGNKLLPTPNLDRLAREGARFSTALCPFPVCVPSRASMLTGQASNNTRVRGNAAADDATLTPDPSFDNILHSRDYKTHYHGKWHSPYHLARTYLNRPPTVPQEAREFHAWLDKNVPRRQPRSGELLENFYGNRPYRPYPVDQGYADAQANRPNSKHDSQQEVIGVLDIPSKFTNTAFTVDRTLQSLDELKSGPFSLTCSIGPPHPPFLCVEPYASRFPAPQMPLPANWSHDLTGSPYRQRAESMSHYHNADYVRQLTASYYAMVAEIDDQIGRVLSRLDSLNLSRKTLVVFTSDHGEMLGAHGLVSKMVFHEEAVRVPLLMRLPGQIPTNTVIPDPVSGLDLFSTILDYLNVPTPPRDGLSLRPLIERRTKDNPDYRVVEWGTRNAPNYMVRTANWKYFCGDSPQSRAIDALYDLRNDAGETRNLLHNPTSTALTQAREMKDRLLAWLTRVHSPALDAVKGRPLG